MQRILLALFTVFIAFALPVHDAEAKRFGGGRSSGIQRDALPQKQVAPQPAAPTGAGVAPAGQRSWLGPVAGLAAGLGLAALASHFGLGEEFANVMMIALLAMAALFLFRWLTRRAIPQGMQYAGQGAGGNVTPFPAGSAAAAPMLQAVLPAGFDAEAFTRQAKLNFIRLQAASDAGNLDDIREFTSPEMYAEIKLQLAERGSAAQRTEVLMLDAEVLECVEGPTRYLVSVRFHGLIREEADAPAFDFDEVWHLTKSADGKAGWVVAGIQQMQ
ncbi:MAG: Tim44-like domain-containing protein [Gallionellaceae bacterium]|nr:Tim44-like domain-containing protein [Gallionellaceae bacterium]